MHVHCTRVHAPTVGSLTARRYSLADAAGSAASGARIPPGHVTNYAQNEDGQVWDSAGVSAQTVAILAW